MSILIKGMEMPTSCFYCPFREKVNPDDYVCMALNEEFEETFSLIAGKRYSNCPLIPVPPHGRLIDTDAVSLEGGPYEYDEWCKWALVQYQDAPTIIPAEEGE